MEDIDPLSETPDLEIQIENAKEEEIDARSAKVTAENELQKANQDQPKPLGPNERADMDPELPQPETAAEALQMRGEKYQLASQFNEEVENLRESVSDPNGA